MVNIVNFTFTGFITTSIDIVWHGRITSITIYVYWWYYSWINIHDIEYLLRWTSWLLIKLKQEFFLLINFRSLFILFSYLKTASKPCTSQPGFHKDFFTSVFLSKNKFLLVCDLYLSGGIDDFVLFMDHKWHIFSS